MHLGTAWQFTEKQCEICADLFYPVDYVVEMYDPKGDDGSLIVHHHCGLGKGMEVA